MVRMSINMLESAKKMLVGTNAIAFRGHILPLYHMATTSTRTNINFCDVDLQNKDFYAISVIVDDTKTLYECSKKEFRLIDCIVAKFAYPEQF